MQSWLTSRPLQDQHLAVTVACERIPVPRYGNVLSERGERPHSGALRRAARELEAPREVFDEPDLRMRHHVQHIAERWSARQR